MKLSQGQGWELRLQLMHPKEALETELPKDGHRQPCVVVEGPVTGHVQTQAAWCNGRRCKHWMVGGLQERALKVPLTQRA